MIVLGEKNVVASRANDLGTDITLAEHGIAGDDVAADRQDAHQLKGGLVFIGLGVHANLRENGLDARRVGGDEMLAGRFTVAATAGGLAIEGDVESAIRQPCGDPACQDGFEGADIELTKQDGEGGRGGRFATSKAQDVGEGEAFVAAEL